MGVTTKRKQTICEQYCSYLDIIYYFGNKVILLKQLWEYAEILGFAKNYPQFLGHIKELVEADILRQEPFVAFGKVTQLHMLTLKKYAIRFVEGKNSSQSVGAVPKSNTNERIIVSIFKNVYILDKIIPRLKKQGIELSCKGIKKMLENDRSTLLYNKNKGLDYVYTWEVPFLQKYLSLNMLNYDIRILEEIRNKKYKGLEKGSKASVGKGKGKVSEKRIDTLETAIKKHSKIVEAENNKKGHQLESQKLKKLDKYNIDSMLNAYAYISQLREIKGVFTATILLFDIYNNQDVYKMTTHIASIYHMFYRYLSVDTFKLKFGIVAFDEEAQKNMESVAKRQTKDRISKELKGEQLKVTLKNWNISEDILEKYIEIHFTNYNLTNRYLDGVKHSNLKRK